MKKLIVILSLLASTPAFASTYTFTCRGVSVDATGSVSEIEFDDSSAAIGESYMERTSPRAALKTNAQVYRHGNLELAVQVDKQSQIKSLKSKLVDVDAYIAKMKVNIGGEKYLFTGTCVEQLNK